jgi:hypothetical protein
MGLAGGLGCSSGSASPNGSRSTDGDAAGVDAGGESSALGPGCLGSPGQACAPAPEGSVCPGGPNVCVLCGPGTYTQSISFCRCTSGIWACAPPTAAQISCPSPAPNSDFYADPACSVPYGSDAAASAIGLVDASTPIFCRDAGPAVSCADADIQASNYDQTCQTDSDCILVGEGQSCSPCSLAYGPYGAIRRGALPQYEADVAKTPAGNAPVSCAPACAPSPSACCRGGHCFADGQCSGDAG